MHAVKYIAMDSSDLKSPWFWGNFLWVFCMSRFFPWFGGGWLYGIIPAVIFNFVRGEYFVKGDEDRMRSLYQSTAGYLYGFLFFFLSCIPFGIPWYMR